MPVSKQRRPTRRRRKTWEDYLREQIARIWGWDEERKKAKKRAQVGPELFRCEGCGDSPLPRSAVEIDHIMPRMPVTGWDGDWTGYIARTFCPASGLQVLCHECHDEKSEVENAARRAAKQ